MRLKSKLALSFILMLVLMAVLSFLGWQGIERMELKAQQAIKAQDVLTASLLHQLNTTTERTNMSEAPHSNEAAQTKSAQTHLATQAALQDLRAAVTAAEQQSQARRKELDSIKQRAQISMFGTAAFAVLLAVATALYLNNNVHSQLGRDPSTLAILAQRVTDGDYDIDDGSPRQGVYGNLLLMVETLREHIRHDREESAKAQAQSTVATKAMHDAEEAGQRARDRATTMLQAAKELEEVIGVVSVASTQLSAHIAQSQSGAAQQSTRAGQTAGAMEEMNAIVLDVARNAGAASRMSAEARDKAQTGAHVVRDAVNSIQEVQRQSMELKDQMGALSDKAHAITQIMNVISDIADQTNLLALNAAIEAARAGEAGRGFSVVADEVRKLAEKTQISTVDVAKAVREIQQSADQSVTQVEKTVLTIEEATHLAGKSGEALQDIVRMVDSAADQVQAIAAAAEQQSAASEEIKLSIFEVNTIAEETLKAMHEAAGAVTNLAGQAKSLSRLVGNMKSE